MDIKATDKNVCVDCGTERSYNETYDTYYCESCNKWLEEKCSDPECEFCLTRPNSPFEMEEK